MKHTLTAALVAALLFSAPLWAEDSFKGYHQADTEHFTFVFDKDGKEEAVRFAAYADTAWKNVARVYGMPQDKTMVFMNSNTDVINAFAMPESFYMSFYTTPSNMAEFGFRTNWHEIFFTHELIHIANMNFEGRRPDSLKFLGSYLNTIEAAMEPGFALEGLTTVLETELTAGGRGRSPYFELKYKAPAMENSMVPFAEIGSDIIPPYGQIYVYGYLLSRTIADTYGLDALASIERNRSLFGSWFDAVYTVTGVTAENLYNDAKKALDKRYAAERMIPEGITITPHGMNEDYYGNPVVLDDGSMIILRSLSDGNRAIVQFDPQYQWEEVLVDANPDSFSASKDGFIVFTTATTIGHRGTGVQETTDLYTWDPDNGYRQLTSGTSLFEPALSYQGNRLVATEIHDGRYRIVEVSLETGERTVILESPDADFIQPSLIANGTWLTCLEANDTRAAVVICQMPMPGQPDKPAQTFKRIYNDVPKGTEPTEIFDPAYPAFVGGKITFTSNERGRLERYECNRDGSELQPVLADPVGVLWAMPTNDNIYYSSYASTGWVIKAKPVSEWGTVPDFEGPSKPGEIITFGNLTSDYPDYDAFKQETWYFTRNTPYEEQAAASAVTFTLQNERRYVDIPHLMLLFPDVNVVKGPDKTYWGFGMFAMGMSHVKQNQSAFSVAFANAEYFPSLKQITGNIAFTGAKGSSETILVGMRSLESTKDVYRMTERTGGMFSIGLPLYTVSNYFKATDTALIAGGAVLATRSASEPFALNADIDYQFNGQCTAGLEHFYGVDMGSTDLLIDTAATTTFTWQPDIDLSAFVYEGSFGISAVEEDTITGITVKGRWFDLPESATIPMNITSLKASSVSCLYPGRIMFDISSGITTDGLSVLFFAEKMLSFGTSSTGWNTPDNGKLLNLTWDKETYIGGELTVSQGRAGLAAGMVIPVSALKDDDSSELRFYATVKMNGFRFNSHDTESVLF
ncbi:MAG: hypothetical protein MJ178_04535 [Treponemataceae bacterium]|nr:hypothetical protein [Treponemataceae bacterium]